MVVEVAQTLGFTPLTQHGQTLVHQQLNVCLCVLLVAVVEAVQGVSLRLEQFAVAAEAALLAG